LGRAVGEQYGRPENAERHRHTRTRGLENIHGMKDAELPGNVSSVERPGAAPQPAKRETGEDDLKQEKRRAECPYQCNAGSEVDVASGGPGA
jgi:hypothetical protein